MYWKLAEDENENHCVNRYSRLLQEKNKETWNLFDVCNYLL